MRRGNRYTAMWHIRDRGASLPRSFYQKARQLERQAREEPDPEIRRLQLEAAARYYKRDAEPGEPLLRTVLWLVVCYLAVIAVAIYTFRSFPLMPALTIVGGSYVTLALLIGASFRAAGYISEDSLMGIFRAGLKFLVLRSKLTNPKG
jgi:hypothetical protein